MKERCVVFHTWLFFFLQICKKVLYIPHNVWYSKSIEGNTKRKEKKMEKLKEEKIIEILEKSGLTHAEASRDAFLMLEAWRAGEIEPETMRNMGFDI